MIKKLFEGDILALPVVGLLLFVAIFVTALVWVLRRERTAHYRHMATLPLLDGDSTRVEGDGPHDDTSTEEGR